MASSARKYVIKLTVTRDFCVLLLVVTLFPAVTQGSSCVQNLPGPGECANATNPYAADNTTGLASSTLTCSFSDLCVYRQGCQDLDMSAWFVTDGVATANQTSPRCGTLEAYSILESPWVNFSTLTCVSFTFLRLTPFDLDVFFEVRDSHVVTVVDRNQFHHHHSLNYTEEVTVHPLIGKLQFRAFGGGYGSPSYLHLYPVSVSSGSCDGQSGVVITATPPPSSTNTNTTTAASNTTAPAGAVTAAATTTAAAAATTKSSGITPVSPLLATNTAPTIQSGSTLPSGSQQSTTGHVSGSPISATSPVPSSSPTVEPVSSQLSANCEGQKREEEDRLGFGTGVIVGIIIGVVASVASLITGFLLYKKCFANRQIHPHLYISDKAPLDTSRRDTSRRDTSRRDTSRRDTSRRDTSRRDTSRRDTSRRDTSRPVTATELRLPL